MRVREEFSRYASVYGQSNVIQRKVAQKLVSSTLSSPKRVLDLGCGSGTVFSCIEWEMEHFVGVDFSESMLSHHPRSMKTELLLGNFNDPALFDILEKKTFDHIYSASALQWADDLSRVLEKLAHFNTPLSLAIFTSGTFKTLMQYAHLPSLLRSVDEVIACSDQHLDARYEILHYSLEFDSVREMFRYIKRSGVSGGRRVLSVSQMKKLMETYPLNYLEFEILVISAN